MRRTQEERGRRAKGEKDRTNHHDTKHSAAATQPPHTTSAHRAARMQCPRAERIILPHLLATATAHVVEQDAGQ